MRACGVWLLVGLMACGKVLKPAAPDRRLNIVQTGSVFEANNGYLFAVLPEPHASVIRMDVRYPVGAADDPAGKAGLAHLVEHLLFEVEYSRGGEKTSISAELGRVALSWNAETHEDYTTYQTLFAPEFLGEVVGLEVNRLALGCAGLTPEIFAREREVVLNELRQRQGASGAQLQRAIFDEIYPAGHPYRAVDTVESVAKLELKDACEFISTQYQRGKAVVVVSGDVREKDVQAAASKQFIRLKKRNLATKQVPPVANPKPGTVKLKADIEEAALFMAAWSLPPKGTKEYRLLETAWPTFESLIEQQAYMYKWGHTGFTQVLGGARAPVLVVGIYLNSPGDAGEAKSAVEAAVRSAFDSLYLGADGDAEQWRSRMYSRAEMLLASWESLDSRNDMFGDFLMFDTTPELIIGRVAELRKSGPGDVRSLGERWLGAQHARYLIVEPSGTMPTQGGRTYAGGQAAHATKVDASIADKPLPAPPPRPPLQVDRYELGNGLSVALWANGNAPVARARLVVDSGEAHEPAGREGLASLLGGSAWEDSVIFSGRELSIVVDNLIVEIGLELRNPGLPLSDEQKDYIKARLHSARANERQIYETKLAAAVYGEKHPYARPDMTEASISKLSHDQVLDWSRAHVVAKNSTLIVTGQFDANLIKQHIAFNLDQVNSGSDSADIEFDPPSALRHYVQGVSAKSSPTIELDVLFATKAGIDDDHAKRLVLEHVLRAELSRLRTDRALTYGFNASYSPRKGGGMWRLGGDADATRAAEAATHVLAILDGMRADPESYRASFVLARQKVIEGLLVSAGDSRTVADQLVFTSRFDLSDSFYDRLPEKVAKITLQEFHEFMRKELYAGRQVFGAFGEEEPVAEALAAARAVGGK